ncbi:MAG: succinate dehydrogenase/fumarate reductase iron-sulfur subunit [Deltaproteobacteria bacterium]|nr:succinate dehydrogenase/fumarate reductase iron-sulfur subunit [Deltaproteobacteria bacterium]
MDFTLKVWRQEGPDHKGRLVPYAAKGISADTSFLEMLDIVNERLIEKGEEPIAFDHDCREGICGMCGCVVNGYAHGPEAGTTLCQLHMRHFHDGDTIYVEPFRAKAFPVIRDLVVNRGAFDAIVTAGGYISIRAGSAPDANAVPVPKEHADRAMDAAACIGCGACVASCPNASAMLFTSAKISQLGLLPQGQPERWDRVRSMVSAMERAGFGSCTNHGECEATCPKRVSMDFIARMNRDLMRASVKK